MNLQATPRTVLSARGRTYGKNYRLAKGSRMWELNETGSLIWRLCDGTRTLDQVFAGVAEYFECERSESDTPCLEFVNYLVQQQLLTIEA